MLCVYIYASCPHPFYLPTRLHGIGRSIGAFISESEQAIELTNHRAQELEIESSYRPAGAEKAGGGGMGRPPCCDKVGVKKGPWTPEEDLMLVSYVQEHGPGNWRAVPTNTGL